MPESKHRIWTRYQPREVYADCACYRSQIAEDDEGQRVVVHEISFADESTAAIQLRFEYETARLALLTSQTVSAPIDFETDEQNCCVVCPWVEGRTLADQLARGPLTLEETLSVSLDLLAGLNELHADGLIRRCLRPSEVKLIPTANGMRAVIDGFAPLMLLHGLAGRSLASEFATYASPEALGALEEDVRPASDLYSFGAVLFECLTGQVPFPAEDPGELVFHHMTSPVPSLDTVDAIPSELAEIVQRLLCKHPRDRYQSAAGVRHDIQQLSQRPPGATSTSIVLGTMDERESLIEPAFVGRVAELELIGSQLQAVKAGSTRTLRFTAPSGLGKSRLLLETTRQAAALGFRTLRAQGQNQVGQTPLASLRNTLSQYTELIRQDEQLRIQSRAALEPFVHELQSVLPDVLPILGLEPPETSGQALSDRRIAFVLATLLGTIGSSERPVLLLLDDVQWADDLTLTMLECWKLTKPHHTLLVVSMRADHELGARISDSLVVSGEISLQPLTKAENDQLLESMAGTLPAVILDEVWEMSNGNPFLSAAVLRGLVEGDVLRPSDHGWEVDADRLQNLQTSGEAAQVLQDRLYRLPEECQRLLAVGAVLGKEFDITMAAELADIRREQVLDLLIEPRRNQLVWNPGSGNICAFMHDRIRESMLQSLPDTQRTEIHYQAARYLQATEPDRIFDIAYHFDAADRPELAGPFAAEAAEQARNQHALESAELQYRIALRSFERKGIEPTCAVLHGLGDVLMLGGRYSDAEQAFEQALSCADSTIAKAEVTLKLGELAFKQDAMDRAIELWEAALRELGGRLPPGWLVPLAAVREILVQAAHTLLPRFFVGRKGQNPPQRDRLLWRLHSRLAHGYWYVRGKLSVLHIHLRGMNLAERYEPTSELAQAYSEHAPAMSLIPLTRRGIAYGRRSLEIRTAQQDIWGQGQSLYFLAIALYSAAQFEECADVARRSVRILDRAGDLWEKHIAQYQLAASLYRLGRFQEAVQLSREAYDSGLAVGDEQICADIIEVWARATHGELPAEIIQRELDRQKSDVQAIAHVRLARCVQLLAEHKYEAAVSTIEEGVRTFTQAGIVNAYTSPLLAWQATAIRKLLEQESPLTRSARQKLLRAHRRAARRAVFVAMRFRNELPHALREYAISLVFQNRNRKAIRKLNRALRICRQQSAAHEQIECELVLQQIRSELKYPGASKALQDAEKHQAAFRDDQLPRTQVTTISLADRFEALLDSGRQIASSTEPQTILQTARSAVMRLLRSNHCDFITRDTNGQPEVSSESIRPLVMTAINSGEAVIANSPGHTLRSALSCPILVRGEIASVLLVGNTEVRDLYGPNEQRVASYIATVTGAALENAEGFRELQELNTNLEQIVAERTAAVEARSLELERTANDLRETQIDLADARDAAESANRAKTQFLTHLSHEIRTPIAAVLGFTELLQDGPNPLDAEQREFLQRIHSNGTHLQNLLNDLLDLSRIEAGKLSIECLDVAPFSLLRDVLESLQSRAISKGLKLLLKANGPIPTKVQSDPTRLRQIITNLVSNAIKFTDEGQVEVEVSADVEHELLRIRVTDTGIGIDPEAQTRVFERFSQADQSVVRRFGGTGLGLSISRMLAQALGGEIELSSEVGLGSTFTLTVATGPLQPELMQSSATAERAIAQPVLPPHDSIRLDGVRILIADDVEANRDFLSRALQRAGADSVTVSDGQQAVEACRAGEFDLILMDMHMPVVDGYTATSRLRDSGVEIPIVALTANGMNDEEQRCRQHGCTGYLAKPISIANLLIGVAQQLGREVDDEHRDSLSQNVAESTPFPTTIDPELLDSAIEFLGSIDAAIRDCRSNAAPVDNPSTAKLAHVLRGTGATIGLPALTEAGNQLEQVLESGNETALRKVFEELVVIVSQLREQLSAAQSV